MTRDEYHQCVGITTSNNRCKLKVKSEHGYCHYHEYQQHHISPPPKPANTAVKYTSSSSIKKQTTTATSTTASTTARLTVTATKVNSTTTNVAPNHSKPGYIYVYTLSMFNSKTNKSWQFKVKNLPNDSTKKWKSFDAKSSPYVLIKIGMTTTTVQKRLNQWIQKCNHDVSIVVPRAPVASDTVTTTTTTTTAAAAAAATATSKSRSLKQPQNSQARIGTVELDRIAQTGSPHSLSRLLSKLKISNSPPQPPLNYNTFNNDGFYCGSNVRQVERTIHNTLHKKYGRGDFYCPGCSDESNSNSKTSTTKLIENSSPFKSDDYNVHIEWFLIPKLELRSVFELINSICLRVGV